MDIFDMVGSFGPWQLRIFMVFISFNILGMWHNFSVSFLAPNMDFHCVQASSSLNNETFSNLTFDERCEVPQGGNSSDLVPCTRWEYNTSVTSETIVSEWDLVCDREWLISLAKSIYMVGFLFSVIIFGQVSDCIGRFPTIVICYLIAVISMFLSLWSQSFVMFAILRFFQAFGRSGVTTVGYVLVMEIVGPKHQSKVGIALQVGWSIGFVTLPIITWFFRHWFWIQLILSVVLLPFVFTFKVIPESPRWLLTQGKIIKLEKLLTKAAKVNGRHSSENVNDMNKLKMKMENKGKKASTILEVFKMPKMRWRILNMIYIWIVNAFLYYALSYNTNDLAGNIYINFFISGALEFPSYGLVYWGLERWGRRPTLITLMVAGGAACLAILPVPADLPWLATTFAMIGKFCITGSFRLIYLYTTEMFPTSVRNACLGSCSMFARIGSILAPFVRDLGKATHSSVPSILYTSLTVSSGLLALWLPETRGQDIPDTMQEAEDLGQSNAKYGEVTNNSETISLTDK